MGGWLVGIVLDIHLLHNFILVLWAAERCVAMMVMILRVVDGWW